MKSIRRQLVVTLFVSALAVLAVGGWILHGAVTDSLTAQFDVGLEARARALGAMVEREGIYVEVNFHEEAMPQFVDGADLEYFTMWLEGQTKTMTSPSLGGRSLERRSAGLGERVVWDAVLPDGRPGRVIGVDLPVVVVEDDDGDEPDDDDEEAPLLEAEVGTGDLAVTVVVATSRESLDSQLAALGTGLAFASVASAVLLAVVIMFAVRRGLEPVEQLAARVAAVDAQSLTTRVDGDAVPVELKPITSALDALFARLDESFAKERRMTAAMAHELRTPIAELRSASDVARAWPDDDSMVDEVIATAGEVARRMGTTIESLMRYCRLEAGQARLEVETIALRPFVDALWVPHSLRADERGLVFVNNIADDALVASDSGLLAIALGNLLQNAASFASGGDVDVRSSLAHDGTWSVSVANFTDDLTSDDLVLLSEPFWRKDEARSSGQHSGLGLTLVRAVASVLGCTVASQIDARVFTMSLAGLERASSVDEADSSSSHHVATSSQG